MRAGKKSAFFILGPEKRTVGYVAAIVAANRKVIRQVAEESGSPMRPKPQSPQQESEMDESPHILQVYVEPEFRRRGLAVTALALLLRGHNTLKIDDPTWPVTQMLEGLGYTAAGASDGPDGRPNVRFVKTIFAHEK